MKNLILLGAFITSLATVQAAFADAETYIGSNCAVNSEPGIFTSIQHFGMQVTNNSGLRFLSMMCPAVNQEELDNYPSKAQLR